VSALKAASALKQKTLGPDDPDVGISEGNLGNVLHEMGRNDEALVHADRGVMILQAKLGAGHPDLARLFNNLGEILNGLGRFQSARERFERAVAIFEREIGPNAAILAYPLTGIGLSYLGQNKPTNALIFLERAFKIRIDAQVDLVDKADTAFALARALWDSSRDRDRARHLAGEAKTIYSKGAGLSQIEDVDRWLRSHRSTRPT
jgi:tetratricopeptide (TPR) repeat protein